MDGRDRRRAGKEVDDGGRRYDENRQRAERRTYRDAKDEPQRPEVVHDFYSDEEIDLPVRDGERIRSRPPSGYDRSSAPPRRPGLGGPSSRVPPPPPPFAGQASFHRPSPQGAARDSRPPYPTGNNGAPFPPTSVEYVDDESDESDNDDSDSNSYHSTPPRRRSPRPRLRRPESSPSPEGKPRKSYSGGASSVPERPRTERPYSYAGSRPAWDRASSSGSFASGTSLGAAATAAATRPASTSFAGVSDKSFRYQSLGRSEIRLVRILRERMSMIKCQIVHASLADKPSYVAVSYAWGDEGDKRDIHVDGAVVPITKSLHGALRVLRRQDADVLVWADALCIDQRNDREKTEQVQLMMSIYSKAERVAVWLGEEADDSGMAVDMLATIARRADTPEFMRKLIASQDYRSSIAAIVALFERDYWLRLWVVQEIFNARDIVVYCGDRKQPWSVYLAACDAFWKHKGDLDQHFPSGQSDGVRHTVSKNQLAYSAVLVYQGPGSFPDLDSLIKLGDGSLLKVLRECRRKLAAKPQDKVFGLLGVLPPDVRLHFRPDYDLSVTEVYTNVVDYLLTSTKRLDVICEAVYFPLHSSSLSLPSWVPDWSHIPQTAGMGLSYDFDASGGTAAKYSFKGDRRARLEIEAIHLDRVRCRGIAVGTLCTLEDFLVAFLHWRSLLLEEIAEHYADNRERQQRVHETFCRTLCLDQAAASSPRWKDPAEWTRACYHVFASLLRERLPHMPLDPDLAAHARERPGGGGVERSARRRLLHEHCASQMKGRCLFLTGNGLVGMGTGFMAYGDVVVVPLGCRTPVVLRPLGGGRGEYRFVGDAYVDGYMNGRAVRQWKAGEKGRELRKYVLQ